MCVFPLVEIEKDWWVISKKIFKHTNDSLMCDQLENLSAYFK